MEKWNNRNFGDIVTINPKESLKKGNLAKKITMDMLQPFCRDVPTYEISEYNGGTKFRNGDTIMARITPCLENGKTSKINILDENEIGFGSTEYIVLRAIKGMADEDFIYYLVCSPIVREPAIKSMVGSSGRQRVQIDVLQNLEVNIPCLELQHKIGVLLKSIDDKIAINTKINENLEQQAQTIFKSWFVDFEPFDREMPKEWKKTTLENVSNISAGGDKPQMFADKKTAELPYPIYSNGVSNAGLYGYTNDYKISDESVTVSARGTIGFVCLRHEPFTPIVRLVTLIPKKEEISAKYLYLWLKTAHISGTGTTQQQLTVPSFKKTEILLPDSQTMKKFTDIVNSLFERIWSNQSENSHLSDMRDTLLPKLMSGKIDVSKVKI